MPIIDKTAEESGRGYQILSAKKYEQSTSGDGDGGSENPEEQQSISGEESVDNSGTSGEPAIFEPGISAEPSIEEQDEEVPSLPF